MEKVYLVEFCDEWDPEWIPEKVFRTKESAEKHVKKFETKNRIYVIEEVEWIDE